MSRARLALIAVLALGGGMVSHSTARAGSAAGDLYYERTVMLTAGQRCGLFSPGLLAALASAQAQARGAALRAGTSSDDLDAVQRRASAKATAAPCGSRDLGVAAARVRTAFQGFAQLNEMTYPGDTAPWRADRSAGKTSLAAWRLIQDVRFGWDHMSFGLAGRNDAQGLMAVAAFADGAQPYAARLVIRDTALTSGPFLNGRSADAHGRIPLASRLPPRSATRTFNAEARSAASRYLIPAGASQAWAFRFPDAAAPALARLDPRESVAVEFAFAGRGGDQVRTAYVEVGDFAAGQAFLTVAQR